MILSIICWDGGRWQDESEGRMAGQIAGVSVDLILLQSQDIHGGRT